MNRTEAIAVVNIRKNEIKNMLWQMSICNDEKTRKHCEEQVDELMMSIQQLVEELILEILTEDDCKEEKDAEKGS